MMIRGLTVSLLFSVLALPAYAQDSVPEPLPQAEQTSEPAPQDNPQTRQTDEAEDEYRRSQRRRDTGDIFEDIVINRRGSGSGGTQVGPEVKAIDRLDQDSRRHLNKQRAKALAEAKPGEPIDAAYEPSEVAKTDEYVAKQEQRAWEEMLREANNGIGVTQGPKGGSGQSGASESGQGQSGQGQAGGQGQGSSGQAPRPVRGGSATSAAAILDQIKGRSSGSGSEGSQGQTAGGGQSSQPGQAPVQSGSQGGSPTGTQSGSQGSGQTQGQSQSTGQSGQGTSTQSGGSSSSAFSILNQIKGLGGSSGSQEGQTSQGQTSQGQSTQGQSGSQGDAEAQAPVLGQSSQGESTQTGGSASSASSILDQLKGTNTSAAQGQSGSESDTAAEAAAHRETISPLERLKREPVETETTGGRTSASDFLNRGK